MEIEMGRDDPAPPISIYAHIVGRPTSRARDYCGPSLWLESGAVDAAATAAFLNNAAYCPYPSDSSWSAGMKRIDAEFMQYRNPVGAGPSSKTCPKWASHFEQRTSVRTMPYFVSRCSETPPSAVGL